MLSQGMAAMLTRGPALGALWGGTAGAARWALPSASPAHSCPRQTPAEQHAVSPVDAGGCNPQLCQQRDLVCQAMFMRSIKHGRVWAGSMLARLGQASTFHAWCCSSRVQGPSSEGSNLPSCISLCGLADDLSYLIEACNACLLHLAAPGVRSGAAQRDPVA